SVTIWGDSIDSNMGQLLVRNIDDELVRELKLRAAGNGVSAEEEHRRILRAALSADDDREFLEHLMAMPDVGEDSDFEREREFPRETDL
ncbi:MAG TPA: hypothetical protein P5138_08420, partial [Solirubrobacterales bacterium]|nr:hypothetical protein [Solirubrobacterales bacterium]